MNSKARTMHLMHCLEIEEFECLLSLPWSSFSSKDSKKERESSKNLEKQERRKRERRRNEEERRRRKTKLDPPR